MVRLPRRTWTSVRVATAILLGAAPSAFAAEPEPDPIRLQSADRGGVTFEVVVAKPSLRPFGQTGYQTVSLPGFVDGGEENGPTLPERIVWIGAPEGVEVLVTSSGVGGGALEGVRPLPRLAPQAQGGASGTELAALEEAYRPAQAQASVYRETRFGQPAAEFVGWSAIRTQRVAAVRVRPLQYDAASGRLEWPERLQVRIEFRGFAAETQRPRDDAAFEPIYRDLLLNYESARAFRRAMGGLERPSRFAAQTSAQSSADFTVAANWVKVRVRAKGLQRLSGSDLSGAGVPVGSVSSSQLRLFARPGLPVLEEVGYCDTCDLREVAIRVDDGGDGRLDSGDQVLFFGLGASGWSDDYLGPDTTQARWIDHPYENDNAYWLTWNANLATPARRWTPRDVAPTQPGAVTATDFAARLHLEESRVYEPNLYEPNFVWDQWIWQILAQGLGGLVYRADTPGAVTTAPARLRARFWGVSAETFPKTFGFPDHFLRLRINGFDLTEKTWNGRFRLDVDTTGIFLQTTNNVLRAEIPTMTDPANSARSDQQGLLYWELYYRRRFEPSGDLLEFRGPDGAGPSTPQAIAISPVSSSGLASFTLVDVTDPFSPQELVGYVVRDTTGGKALYWHDALAGPRSYFAAGATRFARPRLETATIRDIRSPALSADYVVITYDDFEPQAQRLADHRAQYLPGFSAPRSSVVRISDIYAWYSGGRLDPTAIRNFLYDVTVNGRWSPAPSYVCLLGDASYDFRNQFGFAPSGTSPALVPSYVHGFELRQYLSDDWITDIDIGASDPSPADSIVFGDFQNMPDFFVGRLPAATATEASVMVDEKVIAYDNAKQFGEWRNRVLLVADDQFQGAKVDPLYGVHMQQSDSLEGGHIPYVTDRAKVYLIRYPSESGANKPGANRDIVETLNEGALVWNYIGHGNPFQMSDENAFRVGDVPSLLNRERLTLCVAASCDLGKFDDPTKFGLGEALVKSPSGGAIATISASEIAFSGANFELAAALFSQIFSRPEQSFPLSLGQAFFNAKYRRIPKGNDRKFTLQGDAATRLAHPQLGVRLQLYDDETGAAFADSLPRGRRIRLEGEVKATRDDALNDPRTDFAGTAQIWVTDSAPLDSFRVFPSSPATTYTYDPSAVYRGEAGIVNGRFTARFYVPLEARLGPLARVRAYVRSAAEDGVGFQFANVGEGVPAEVDTVGPTVDLRFTSATRFVAPDAELRIVLSDEHGINVTGNSAANGILLTIDDEVRIDLTKAFRYDAGSYQQGSILFRLPNLSNGNHSIRVTATDNFARGIQGLKNRGEARTEFAVSQAAASLEVQVLPFPSPFRPQEGTEILVNGVAEPSDLSLEVFTTAGRRVRTLAAQSGGGSAQLHWDGKDDFGAQVANGIYLLRLEVRPLAGGPARTAEGRVAAFH